MKRIVFLLYDDVDSLDVVGPYDVFSMANVASAGQPLFQLLTVAENEGTVRCLGGLRMIADVALDDLTISDTDVLVVPGAPPNVVGQFPQLHPTAHDWLKQNSAQFAVTASICFGAIILAHAGLLDGQRMTTHHQALSSLAQLAPDAQVIPGVRYVDNLPGGKIMSSAGVSAGIDLAFHMLNEFAGATITARTTQIMEYNRTQNFAV